MPENLLFVGLWNACDGPRRGRRFVSLLPLAEIQRDSFNDEFDGGWRDVLPQLPAKVDGFQYQLSGSELQLLRDHHSILRGALLSVLPGRPVRYG
jgi:hypothetical protein